MKPMQLPTFKELDTMSDEDLAAWRANCRRVWLDTVKITDY